MKFRTELLPKLSEFTLSHHDEILTIGSCFSDHIGEKLSYAGFTVCQNPFGTTFNIISIENVLTKAIYNIPIYEEDLHYNDVTNKYFHYDFNTKLSYSNPKAALEAINNTIDRVHHFLKSATHIFITLGTSYVYALRSDDSIVANCHKMPQGLFDKKLLDTRLQVESLISIKSLLNHINPNVKLILTVSPVRHIKDGIIENQLSKSMLRVSAHEASLKEALYYYPAYEIMMDDLRDYRFYEEDLIHPNRQAVQYIWEHFKKSYFSENTDRMAFFFEKTQRQLAHRPIHNLNQINEEIISQIHLYYQQYPNLKIHPIYGGY